MNRFLVLASTALLVSSAFACSSSKDSGTGGGGTTSSTTSTTGGGGAGGDATPAGSCVKPGDKGNDVGVGEYCSPSGGQCADLPGAKVCLADLGQDQWFCTKLSCQTDADCGMDAYCHKEMQGAACVPTKCGGGGAGGGGTGGAGGGTTGAGGAGGGQ